MKKYEIEIQQATSPYCHIKIKDQFTLNEAVEEALKLRNLIAKKNTPEQIYKDNIEIPAKIDEEILRKLFQKLVIKKSKEKAKDLLSKYNANLIPDIKPEDYQKIYTDLVELTQ